MRFAKYQALGNDYLVVSPAEVGDRLTTANIRTICDRHYGPGSDGLLVGPYETDEADFGLRLFNPDGGEFEKSGNGLRIFARYLWDLGRVGEEPFSVLTPGGRVVAWVQHGGRRVTVEMGKVSFDSRRIPVQGPPREVIDEELVVGGQTLRYCAATVGNPHCVILCSEISGAEARRLGPAAETDPRFPNRTNVQFMQIVDRSNVRIEIWERGAGYTLASGSSASAAAAVAHRLDLCDARVAVRMPGGTIDISIAGDWAVTMAGPVARVCDGTISDEVFAEKS